MQIFLIIIHVIACLFLIAVILLQAGRGGGLSDMVGGAQTQSILGTETNTFMKRLTEVFAVVFILTSLTLGIISTHRGKSLMEQKRLAQSLKKNASLPADVQKGIQEKSAEAEKTSAASAAKTAESAVLPAAPVVNNSAAPVAVPIPAAATSPSTETQKPLEGNAQ